MYQHTNLYVGKANGHLQSRQKTVLIQRRNSYNLIQNNSLVAGASLVRKWRKRGERGRREGEGEGEERGEGEKGKERGGKREG